MPCRCDDYYDEENSIIKENNQLTAYLCAAMTYLEVTDRINEFHDKTNWKEVGYSFRRLEEWWDNHKIEDEQRRIEENKVKEKNKVRRRAIAKLSVEERKVLGL